MCSLWDESNSYHNQAYLSFAVVNLWYQCRFLDKYDMVGMELSMSLSITAWRMANPTTNSDATLVQSFLFLDPPSFNAMSFANCVPVTSAPLLWLLCCVSEVFVLKYRIPFRPMVLPSSSVRFSHTERESLVSPFTQEPAPHLVTHVVVVDTLECDGTFSSVQFSFGVVDYLYNDRCKCGIFIYHI